MITKLKTYIIKQYIIEHIVPFDYHSQSENPSDFSKNFILPYKDSVGKIPTSFQRLN